MLVSLIRCGKVTSPWALASLPISDHIQYSAEFGSLTEGPCSLAIDSVEEARDTVEEHAIFWVIPHIMHSEAGENDTSIAYRRAGALIRPVTWYSEQKPKCTDNIGNEQEDVFLITLSCREIHSEFCVYYVNRYRTTTILEVGCCGAAVWRHDGTVLVEFWDEYESMGGGEKKR